LARGRANPLGLTFKDAAHVACPDPLNPLMMELRRIREQRNEVNNTELLEIIKKLLNTDADLDFLWPA
jgi:hypothetical protein